MQISTRGRYAGIAMVDLASRLTAGNADTPICLADIAARQQLSQSYLEQLFGKWRRANLVWSARGAGGGYRLACPTEAITFADIVPAVDEPLKPTRCEAAGDGCLSAPIPGLVGSTCQTHDLWVELCRQIAFFLSGITLADVVSGDVPGRAAHLHAPLPDIGQGR